MTLSPAYLAGLIDADGHVSWRRRWSYPLVGVTTTSVELIASLVETVGGSPHVHHRARTVCVADCDLPHVHTRTRCWAWEVSGERAAVLLRAIRPFMVVKGEKADEVLELWEGSLAGMKRPLRRQVHIDRVRAEMAGMELVRGAG